MLSKTNNILEFTKINCGWLTLVDPVYTNQQQEVSCDFTKPKILIPPWDGKSMRTGYLTCRMKPEGVHHWEAKQIEVVQYPTIAPPFDLKTSSIIFTDRVLLTWRMPDECYNCSEDRVYDIYRSDPEQHLLRYLGSTDALYFEDETPDLGVSYVYSVSARQSDGRKSGSAMTTGKCAKQRFVDPVNLACGNEDKTLNVEILGGESWHTIGDNKWLSVFPNSGEGHRTVDINVSRNKEPYSRELPIVFEIEQGGEIIREHLDVRQKGVWKDVLSLDIECCDMILSGEKIDIQSRLTYDDGSSVVLSEVRNTSNGYAGKGVEYYVIDAPIGTKIGGGKISSPQVSSSTMIEIGALYEEYGITNTASKSIRVIPRPSMSEAVESSLELTCFDVTGVPGWNPTAEDAHSGDCSVACKRPSILKADVNRGVLSFWCKLSPEFVKLSGIYGQYLEVCVNDEVVKTLSHADAAEWTQFQILIQEDNSVVSWRHCYAGSAEEYGTAYLDDISLDPMILTRLEIEGPDRILSRIDPMKMSGETAVYNAIAVYNGLEDQKVAYEGARWSTTGSGASIVGGDIGCSCRILAEDVLQDQQLVLRVADANDESVFAEKTITVKYIESEVAIAEVLDCPALKFAAGGADGWRGVLSTSKVGESSARSTLKAAADSWIQTSVPWGGTLSFWIKGTGGAVDLEIDGEIVATYGLTEAWGQKTVVLSKGAHTVRWVHRSDNAVAVSAWLDGIEWNQDAPQLQSITIVSSADSRIETGEKETLYCRAEYDFGEPKFVSPVWSILSGADHVALSGNVLSALSVGTVSVKAEYEAYGVNWTSSRVYDIVGSDENLSSAVGCDSLSFTTGGDAIWHHQSSTYYDVGGAAQSGDLGKGQSCWMETVIKGPCKLTWCWKNDSWGAGDELQVLVDGVVSSKTGGTAWVMAAINLGEDREYCVRWLYQNMSGASAGLRHGWIDRVRIEELDAPTVVRSISIEGPVRAIDSMMHDYKCYAHYDNGQTVRVKPTWSIATGDDFCNIDDSGCLWAWGIGSARIKATYSFGGKTCTEYFDLEVVKTLTGLQVIGEGSIPAGSHRVYKCRAIYNDGSEVDVRGELSIASIYRANDSKTNGFARLDGDGTLYACTNDIGHVVLRTVYAESGITLTNDMKVAVSIPDDVSLKIEGAAVARFGTSEQYKAILTFGEDSLQAEVSPTWSIFEGSECATISTSGVLKPKHSGNVRLRAYKSWGKLMIEYKDVVIATSGTNKGTLKTIYIQGPSSVEYGSAAQYRCFGVYENGSVAAEAAIWQVTNCGTNGWMTNDGVLETVPLEGRTGNATVKASVGALLATKSISLTVHYEEIPIGLALGGGLQYERTDPTNWFGQTVYSYDGEGAARTRLNTSVRSSSIKSEVLGPGRLSFKWSQKAQTTLRRMQFLIDGVRVASIQKSNDYGWKTVEQDISEGRHELEWRYVSDSSNNTTNWFVIDDVVWIGTPPFVGLDILGPDVLSSGERYTNYCAMVYDDGSVVTNRSADWSVASGSEHITVEGEGVVLAVEPGFASLAVSCQVGGVCQVTEKLIAVKRRNVGIQIDGPDFLALGVPAVYSCRALYSDGSSEVVNPTWQVESGKVALNTWGVATPYECGVATIGAKCNVDDRIVSVAKEIAVLNLSECLDCASLTFSVYGTGEWAPTAEHPFKGQTALMGCVSKQGGSASVAVACPGAGEIGFCWKMNQVVPGDRMDVLVDGVVKSSLEMQTDWAEVTVKVTGNSYHIVTWRYVAGGTAGQEHMGSCFLDNVTWRLTSTQVAVPVEITGGKEIVVDESWPASLDAQFGAGTSAAFVEKFGSDLSAALLKSTGKKSAAGEEMYVWQDYVAGTDPTNPSSRFTAKIEMVDGEPVVIWSPKLSEAETAKRIYTTYGKKTLEGSHGGEPCTIEPWTPVETPSQGGWRFFKVGVEMR